MKVVSNLKAKFSCNNQQTNIHIALFLSYTINLMTGRLSRMKMMVMEGRKLQLKRLKPS